ncbi:MAG TPA: saccharopine dehydrogenase NADP-binding domain-containing protein [Actinophytocola sp.]|uniref:saccharopine dehydrogenase family protein n=1 Tax=Actinophytocola sp. TaxID=1872138 RepID=UPI002DB8A8CC|nr:saccharopine dehydrogenase NADP-binding domain-containing protein [Actinophytocola sp.]HEU5471436.1 saccharopine dehydrogenase NADP-binding domain-containing protein [Actinophytocola sp.]
MPDRDYDLVLFGASGFTGALTAEYLAGHVPAGCRWALAGRNRTKLAALRERLAATNPAVRDLPLLHADVTDHASVRAVAAATRVVLTTVGPYALYGEPLVAACAEHGTDYLDLTGEPEFVDRMYLRHHARAKQTGARLVHACGFDSIPHDLGAYFTVQQLPEGVPVTVEGHVRGSGTISGGTFHSALVVASRGRETLRAARDRRAADPGPADRRIATPTGRPHRAGGRWSVPLGTIDPQIIGRSAAALPRYGPDFTYRHFASVKRLTTVVAAGIGISALLLLAQIAPARDWLLGRRKPGEGPSPQKRARSWFTVRFSGTGGGRRVITEVSGGDPGYTETAKMLAESALCLAYDELPATAGQVTTAQAMGNALIDRLRAAGLTFKVIA